MTASLDPTNHQASENVNILLVDDNQSILEGISDLLELYGYEVITASDGREALAVMQRHRPDIVISDIMMPVMDGYEFFKTVRSNPDWVPIPFIFLTARGQASDIRRGTSLGADAYVTKPFEPEDLLVAIEGRIKRVRDIQTAAIQDIDQMKQQLITVFSHELRTPLTYIYGYVNLLRDQHADLDKASTFEMLDGIQRGAERLTKLVEDLMLMVRIDSGVVEMEVTLQKTMAHLSTIFREVQENYQGEADARHVEITTYLPPNLRKLCASLYVQDALARLVDNAIKFSKQRGGHVHIEGQYDPDNRTLTINVTDNGIGIEPEKQREIFDSFAQADRELMEQQGLGLGLALTRALIALHGGEIKVESTPGEGSTFSILIPAEGFDVSRNADCSQLSDDPHSAY